MTVQITRKMKEIALIAFLFYVQRCSLLHAAPPIESCPYDSIQVGDTCKCAHELCSKPPCMYELAIAVNSTDSPGNCCTIYSCEGCANDTLIEGTCPCAPGAIINSRGECECIDPHKTLRNNECVCDPNRCELPQICEKKHVPVSEKEGCCVKTKCIKCPDDSFATTNNDEAVEDKCVCYPCTHDCAPNERVVVIQRGSGFPGSCCDLYKCEEKKCVVGDVAYGEGESWETADSHTCRCRDGISFCEKATDDETFRPCHKEGSVYKHNESWMVDSCTNCTCFNGETKCVAHMCEVSEGHLKKPDCQPLNCSKVCPDGYKQNKKGCKICKCAPPYKYDDLLHKYNITRNKLKDILEDYFTRNKTEATAPTVSTTVSSISDTTPNNHHSSKSNSRTEHWLVHVILWPTLAVVAFCILFLIMMRKYRSHGSYDTNSGPSTIYERVKLKKDTLFNNNYINKNVKGGV